MKKSFTSVDDFFISNKSIIILLIVVLYCFPDSY